MCLCVSVSLWPCGVRATRGTADPNVITLAVFASPTNFDPRVGTDEVSQKVYQLVYDNLLNLDDQLRVGPGLATGWEQPDDLTYVVHLRRGVRFHDGHELTSADVAYTFNSLIDPSFVSARRGAYALLERVEAVDPVHRALRPEEAVRLVSDSAGPADRPGRRRRRAAHESGRDRAVSASFGYAVDDRLELAAVRRLLRRRAAGTPGSCCKVVPDEIMRGLELQKGTVDLVVNDLSPDTVEQLGDDSDMQVVTSPGTDYAYVGLNLRDPRPRGSARPARDRPRHRSRGDRQVPAPRPGTAGRRRRAARLMGVQGRRVPVRLRSRARAARCSTRLAIADPDGDGPASRAAADAQGVDQRVLSPAGRGDSAGPARKVGIELDVRSYEFATLSQDVARGNFQLVTLQWVGISDPDMLRRVFHSKQVPPNGFNRGFYSNPDGRSADRRGDGRGETTPSARALYGQVQQLVAEDAPYISLWYKTNVAVAQRTLDGIRLTPLAAFTFLKDVRRAPAVPVRSS